MPVGLGLGLGAEEVDQDNIALSPPLRIFGFFSPLFLLVFFQRCNLAFHCEFAQIAIQLDFGKNWMHLIYLKKNMDLSKPAFGGVDVFGGIDV